MRRLCVSICCSAVLLGLVGSAAGQGFSDEAIDKAIKSAAKFLWTLQRDDGSFPPHGSYPVGPSAMITYALLESGANPQEARMARALKWLAENKTEKTYSLGLRCQAWLAANRTTKRKYLKFLKKDVETLIKSTANGSYGYTSLGLGRSRGDNSNSQYGLLGVWAGALANLEGIPMSYWKKVLKHWKDTQRPDGGWAYTSGASTHKMTAAGIASYFVCLDNAYFADFRDCGGKGLPKDLRRGLKWFEKNFARGPMGNGYFLYGVERVGLASGLKYFGTADWYKLGATKLLAMQRPNGSIPTGYGNGVGTAYGMLFLIRGRHPVLFNKLQRPGDWRNRPRELASLTRRLTVDGERTVNWQIINLKVPVAEWHDAPILYISGAKVPIFTDAELEKLRTFVWQGGTIFSVAECGGAGFKKGIREVYAKLFPKYELQKLDWKHDLYSIRVHYPLKRRPRLHMVSNGIRPLAIHCDEDLAKEWQLNRWATRPWAFRAADNVFNYVTDKGKLRARGVKHWPDKPKAMPPVGVTVARVKHAGQWNTEPLAFQRLSWMMAEETGVGVKVLDGIAIGQLAGCGADLAVLTGTTRLKLTGEQKRQLKAFVEGGGTLLLEAGGGKKAFGRSARAVIDNMFGFDALAPVLPFHPIYNIKDYEITKVTYRRKAAVRLDKSKQPNLWGVSVGGRLAVIYSREDIVTGLVAANPFGCDGYAPRSAFEIMRNILLHVADQKAARPRKAVNAKATGNVKVAANPAKAAKAGAKAKPAEAAKSAIDKPVAPRGGDGVRIPERP